MFGIPQERMGTGPRNEAFELLKAWGGTTLAFAILMRGGVGLPRALLLAAVTVALGIIGHELAHRAVARRFGCWARFIANDAMLVLAILLALATGFLFAAPGAVWHSGTVTRRQSGLIAAAGPATNLVLAVICLGLLMLQSMLPLPLWLQPFVRAGYFINAWLGLFNMIPFGPLDGAKVLNWSSVAFAVMAGTGLLLVFIVPRVL